MLSAGPAAAAAAAAAAADSNGQPESVAVAAAKPAWPTVDLPNYAGPGPFTPIRLPVLEHTCELAPHIAA